MGHTDTNIYKPFILYYIMEMSDKFLEERYEQEKKILDDIHQEEVLKEVRELTNA